MVLTAIFHQLWRAKQGRSLAACGSPGLRLAFTPAICLLLGNSKASDEWSGVESVWIHSGGTAGLCALLQLQTAHKLCSSTNWYRRCRVHSVIVLICSCLRGRRHDSLSNVPRLGVSVWNDKWILRLMNLRMFFFGVCEVGMGGMWACSHCDCL